MHNDDPKEESFFDEGAEPKIVVIPAGGIPGAAPKPTLKDVAWKLVWALVFFLVLLVLAGLVITWLWNENLAAVTGLPEIELRTAVSGIILFRLASFIWRM